MALIDRGRNADAVALFRQILGRAPGNSKALYGLGLALTRAGQFGEAIAAYQSALKQQRDDPLVLADLGAVFVLSGNPTRALPYLRRAEAARPREPSILLNIGRVLGQMGKTEEAHAYNARALAIDPDNVMALNNQGTWLLDAQRFADAIACFNRILALDPTFETALFNRAIALAALGHPETALQSYDQALALRPDWLEAHQNRCVVLQGLRRFDEALASFARILELHPAHAPTLSNRGNMLRDMQRSEEALEDFARALAIDPRYPPALTNRAAALLDLHRYEEAARGYETLIAIDPNFEYGLGYLAKAKMYACEWEGMQELCARITDGIRAGRQTMHPFPLLALIDDSALHLRAARIFAADKFPRAPEPMWRGERYDHSKIRVAYLSGDFHSHATAFLMAGLFEEHDRSRFEITAFSFGSEPLDSMTDRLRPAFDRFLDVRPNSDREIAEQIRRMEIDILVDLKGFTADGRLGILAHRSAPLQVSYLGYPGTVGAPYMDYIIGDPMVTPADVHHHYSECVVTLPDSYQVNDSKRAIDPNTPARAECGLPDDGFVFCCFNNTYKITPAVFDIWMRLLAETEGSVLWLLRDNDMAMHNLRNEAAKRSIDPMRLIFAPRMPLPQHLARHRLADLSLDTLPYNAHTTASDALWTGLPIITRAGESFAARVAASLLTSVGLPELITHSAEEYEALALRLAHRPEELAVLKEKLARNLRAAPLFDTDRFRRHLEEAYRMMWRRHANGTSPTGFAVPAVP